MKSIKRYVSLYFTQIRRVRESFVMVNGELLKLIYENVTVKDFVIRKLLYDLANKLCISVDFGFTLTIQPLCCSCLNETRRKRFIFDEVRKVSLISTEVAKR